MSKEEKEVLIRGYPVFEATLRSATVRILKSLDKLIDGWEHAFITTDWKRMGEQNKELLKRFIGEAKRARSILDDISLPNSAASSFTPRVP